LDKNTVSKKKKLVTSQQLQGYKRVKAKAIKRRDSIRIEEL
jgi:hypothetical protein